MADTFDPYAEWLGIEGGRRPPNHYRLLGLKPFESDPESIARAADAALAKVRRVRPGAHLAEWSHLLDRINLTKACLLDPATRKAYDERLSKQSSASPKSVTPPRPSPKQPAAADRPRSPFPVGYTQAPVAADLRAGASPPPKPVEPAFGAPLVSEDLLAEFDAIEVQPIPIVAPSRPASSNTAPIIIGLVALLVVVAGLFIYTMHQRPTSVAGPIAQQMESGSERSSAVVAAPAPPPPRPPAAAPAPAKAPEPATAPVKPPEPKPSPSLPPQKPEAPEETEPVPGTAGLLKFSPVETTKPDAEKPEEVKPQAEKRKPQTVKRKPATKEPKLVAGATTTDAFARAVADARTALTDRDLAAASKYVQLASAEVRTPDNHDQVERLETMLDNLTQFWNGIRASMVKLQAAEEIVIRDTRIVVVDSSRDRLTVKAEGRVHRFRIETMPTSLVMALVRQNFGHDPGSKAVIATFLAVDPKGDRDLARQYWREAAGAGVDCQKLVTELDAMPPVVSRP